MDSINQLKKILVLIAAILVLQVILSIMILYNLTIQSPASLFNRSQSYINNTDSTKIISQMLSENPYFFGNPDSPVTIMEFSDFQCPYCSEVYPIINNLINNYKDKVRFSFHHFPLPNHKDAMQAALSLEAAGRQNKYWEMYNLLSKEYQAQGDKEQKNEQILNFAEKLGLDMATFKNDLNDTKNLDKIQKDLENGKKLGVKATPTVYINGRKIDGVRDYETYSKIIEEELDKIKK